MERAAAGEVIEITRYGRPYASLIAAGGGSLAPAQLRRVTGSPSRA
jgi:antitoxin (DNA-binding transcriptional repressor) of toxin-antitoxin stability system